MKKNLVIIILTLIFLIFISSIIPVKEELASSYHNVGTLVEKNYKKVTIEFQKDNYKTYSYSSYDIFKAVSEIEYGEDCDICIGIYVRKYLFRKEKSHEELLYMKKYTEKDRKEF